MGGVAGDPRHDGAVPEHRPEVEQRRRCCDAAARSTRHHRRADREGQGRAGAAEQEGRFGPRQRVQRAGHGKGRSPGNADAGRVPGDRPCLCRALQPVGNGLQARHVAARPADPANGAQEQRAPEPVGKEDEAEMGQRGRAGADQVDAARRHAVRQRHQHGHGQHIGGEEGANDPSGLGRRQRPSLHIGGQQGGQAEGPDLHQHLGGDDPGGEARLVQRVVSCIWR